MNKLRKAMTLIAYFALLILIISCPTESDGGPVWLYEGDKLITEWRLGKIDNLDAAFEWIEGNAVNNQTYRILLGENILQKARLIDNSSVNNRTGITIILEGKDKERVITKSTGDYLFRVYGGVKFVLGNNITLNGGGGSVSGGARLEMRDGAKITGANVGISMGNGTFTMNGGEITNNGNLNNPPSVGGVSVGITSSRFEMNGGLISGNIGKNAGGVEVNYSSSSNKGTFIKTGGIITGYGDDPVNGNRIVDSNGQVVTNGRGHAVYFLPGQYLNKTVKENHNVDTGKADGWVE